MMWFLQPLYRLQKIIDDNDADNAMNIETKKAPPIFEEDHVEAVRHLCGFLQFCIMNHSFRIRNVVMRYYILTIIKKMMTSNHSVIMLAASKLLGTLLRQPDENAYIRGIQQQRVFDPALQYLADHRLEDTLVNSSILSCVNMVMARKLRLLMEQMLTSWSGRLHELPNVNLFTRMQEEFNKIHASRNGTPALGGEEETFHCPDTPEILRSVPSPSEDSLELPPLPQRCNVVEEDGFVLRPKSAGKSFQIKNKFQNIAWKNDGVADVKGPLQDHPSNGESSSLETLKRNRGSEEDCTIFHDMKRQKSDEHMEQVTQIESPERKSMEGLLAGVEELCCEEVAQTVPLRKDVV